MIRPGTLERRVEASWSVGRFLVLVVRDTEWISSSGELSSFAAGLSLRSHGRVRPFLRVDGFASVVTLSLIAGEAVWPFLRVDGPALAVTLLLIVGEAVRPFLRADGLASAVTRRAMNFVGKRAWPQNCQLLCQHLRYIISIRTTCCGASCRLSTSRLI